MHAELLNLIRERETVHGIKPDWSVDAFMSSEVKPNQRESIVTELYLRLLGLDVSCFIILQPVANCVCNLQ